MMNPEKYIKDQTSDIVTNFRNEQIEQAQNTINKIKQSGDKSVDQKTLEQLEVSLANMQLRQEVIADDASGLFISKFMGPASLERLAEKVKKSVEIFDKFHQNFQDLENKAQKANESSTSTTPTTKQPTAVKKRWISGNITKLIDAKKRAKTKAPKETKSISPD